MCPPASLSSSQSSSPNPHPPHHQGPPSDPGAATPSSDLACLYSTLARDPCLKRFDDHQDMLEHAVRCHVENVVFVRHGNVPLVLRRRRTLWKCVMCKISFHNPFATIGHMLDDCTTPLRGCGNFLFTKEDHGHLYMSMPTTAFHHAKVVKVGVPAPLGSLYSEAFFRYPIKDDLNKIYVIGNGPVELLKSLPGSTSLAQLPDRPISPLPQRTAQPTSVSSHSEPVLHTSHSHPTLPSATLAVPAAGPSHPSPTPTTTRPGAGGLAHPLDRVWTGGRLPSVADMVNGVKRYDLLDSPELSVTERFGGQPYASHATLSTSEAREMAAAVAVSAGRPSIQHSSSADDILGQGRGSKGKGKGRAGD